MKEFNKIIKEINLSNDNFEGWKKTQIMYCKIGWVIDSIEGSEDLEEHVDTLLSVQNFIEKLQKLENNGK